MNHVDCLTEIEAENDADAAAKVAQWREERTRYTNNRINRIKIEKAIDNLRRSAKLLR